jgi:hypothetical protein
MAANPSPPIRLRIPFANAFAPESMESTKPSLSGNCRVDGEQAMRFERRTSDPCLAADAAPGSACFDRFGLGTLRSQRTLLPYDGGRRCAE